MHYQLTQELKTKKLNSLPKDLKKIAEEMVAEKFKLPAIEPKKKKAPVPDEPYNYQSHRVTISMGGMGMGAMNRWVIATMPSEPVSSIMSKIDGVIRDMISRSSMPEGMRMPEIYLESDNGVRMDIRDRRDVEEFVVRMMQRQDMYDNGTGRWRTSWATSTATTSMRMPMGMTAI